MFGRSERLEWRADDLNGGPVLINRTPGGYEAWIALKAGTAAIGAFVSARARKASTFAIAVAPDGSRVTPGSGAASPIALEIHFVAQQALCNALGA